MLDTRIAKALDKIIHHKRDQREYGILGRYNGDNDWTIWSEVRSRFVIIKMMDGNYVEVLNAGKGSVPARPGLRVQLIRKYNGDLVLDGEDTRMLEGDTEQSDPFGNRPHPFISHTDVPTTYAGSAGKLVKVNVGENALIFVADTASDENIRDVIGAALAEGSGIDITVNDAGDTITIASLITQYTDEMARDAAGLALIEGAGIDLTVNDAGDTITVASIITQYTDEMAQDAVGALLIDSSTIDVTYNDAGNAETIDVKNDSITKAKLENVATSTIRGRATAGAGDPEDLTPAQVRTMLNVADGATVYTDEMARDAAGFAFVEGAGIDLTVNDPGDTITIASTITQYTDEMAQDAAGALFSGTETDITIAYNDAGNAITAAVSPTLVGNRIHAAVGKAIPIAADEWGFWDSVTSLLKKITTTEFLTWLNGLYLVLAGVAGGQSANGGNAANEDLTLRGTSHATKTTSYVLIQPDGGFTSIGSVPSLAPVTILHVEETTFDSNPATFGLNATNQVPPRGNNVINRDQSADSFSGYRLDFTTTAPANARGVAYSAGKEQVFTSTLSTQDAYAAILVALNGVLTERLRITSAGLVGFSQPVPAARIHALESTLGAIVQRLQSTATNDDPIQDFFQHRVATTNATPTSIFTVPIPTSYLCFLEGTILGIRTGGSAGAAGDVAVYTVRGVYNNVAGTVTCLANLGTVIYESQPAWDFNWDVSGTDGRLSVTGAANNNITWHAHIYHRFGSN